MTVREVAELLGNFEQMARKHRAAWIPQRQARLTTVLRENRLRQLRRHTKEEIDLGAVSADKLSGVQRTWQAYRDAWVVFARLRNPASASAIRAELTLERYCLLKTVW